MKFFPTTVVDGFFKDPDPVLELAESVEYDDIAETNYTGVASSNNLKEIDEDLFNIIIERLFGYYWDLINPLDYQMYMEFHRIDSLSKGILNKGVIHSDSSIAGGVIYLNKNPLKNTGTSFYNLVDESYKPSNDFLESMRRYHSGKDVDELEKKCKMHYNKYEETMRVQNQYNRLCMYSGDVFHAPTSYGNQIRYTLRFFVDELQSEYQNYPLLR